MKGCEVSEGEIGRQASFRRTEFTDALSEADLQEVGQVRCNESE